MNYEIYAGDQSIRKIWCCAALIPSEIGIDESLFLKCLDMVSWKDYASFVRKGFIRRDLSGRIALTIEARNFCFQVLNPHDRDCDEFLDNLWNSLAVPASDAQVSQALCCYLSASEHLADNNEKYVSRLATLVKDSTIFEALNQLAGNQQRVKPVDAPKLAKLCRYVADEVAGSVLTGCDLEDIISGLETAVLLTEYAGELQRRWLPHWHEDLIHTRERLHYLRSLLWVYQTLKASHIQCIPVTEEQEAIFKLVS